MKSIRTFGVPVMLIVALAVVAQTRAPEFRLVTKFILGGEGGWDYITYDPAGKRLFVAHNDEILAVDAESGKQLGAMPAHGAHGIALVPQVNRGFYTNGRAGTVTVFDLKTLKPIGEIKAGELPDAIIYDNFSRRVIVMNGRSKDLMAIDPEQMKVVATVPLGGKLEYAAADDGHVYVNVEDTGEIAAVDSKNWKPVQRWKLTGCEEPTGLAIDLKTDHLFTACSNAKMIVLDAKSGTTLATVSTGAGTDGAVFDAGLELAFASNGEGTLTMVQEKNGSYEVAENVSTQRGARTLALDPESHRIFLPTAEFGAPAAGQKRPPVKPGTFLVLVFAPTKG